MSAKLLIVFICFLNLWPTHIVEQNLNEKAEQLCTAKEQKIDTLSPLFLINF
jgi:hypothetical protein